MTVGKGEQYVIIPARLEDAKHFKLAEGLQKSTATRLTRSKESTKGYPFTEELLVS
ncbi:MAG: hypothetical protein ASUL_09274 [Candidatus Aramenus sulfurataquae]|uniref:Uncharacterized protein n=1 Tax=Candidatus Aramenus sulfurataquae TaxID=1326980 RepID=W7KJS3_9CREN|nr:MAG: hypothetical protein ASUL_09274 [Candidatus Aramenus sulfurataquae]